MPLLYRNINARLVYLHLALRSGYHDGDRDKITISVRRLAYEVGISVAATRHALKILANANLISYDARLITVTKWVLQDSVTPRIKTKKQAAAQQRAAQELEARERRHAEREAEDKRRTTTILKTGKTSFMVYYESLLERAKDGDVEAQHLAKIHAKTYQAATININQEKKRNQ